MVSGDEATFKQVKAILEAIGPTVMYITNDILAETQKMGLRDKDFAIIYKVLERMSGIAEE